MRVRLVVLTAGKWRGTSILVTKLPFVIGRHRACNVRLISPSVSNRHCALLDREGKVYVCDLGSANGTFLNGEKFTGQRQLHTNDGLRIGSVDFDVCIETSPSPSQPTPLPREGQVLPTNEEDVAALLLSIRDDFNPPSSMPAVHAERLPTDCTATDNPPQARESEPDLEKAKPVSGQPPKADTSTVASSLLQQYLRRVTKS
jgi:pSer/pThr/pTyr-binding forkhead associated (FHA) protein